MYITDVLTKTKKGKLSHRCVLLRESYRENGKVRNRTIANLTHNTPEEIAALKLVLHHKKRLDGLHIGPPSTGTQEGPFSLEQGQSVGAVWTIYQIAKQLGIEAALGDSWQGKLALWQVLARVIDQGSRLSAVRLAQTHAACDILGIRRGFDENDLYANLAWLTKQQTHIEDSLYAQRSQKTTQQLYLYDVTSTYLEGEHNALGAFGYNRDGKKGKKQLVIGLLCDEAGIPLSIEVFAGNTTDLKTFGSQINKVADRFKARNVCFVGDRGMIKAPQMKDLQSQGFNFITAISKPQIQKLLDEKTLQMELFDDPVAEVFETEQNRRYVLRRNPVRAEEMSKGREQKLQSLQKWIFTANADLAEHPLRKVETRMNWLQKRINKLKVNDWLKPQFQGRTLSLSIDQQALSEQAKLDGCYVLVTDLDAQTASKETIHQRYKDLAEVEQIFRSSKTVNLEMRPVHVRNEASTRGHVLVVMLSSLIIRHLRRGWTDLDQTVEGGIKELTQLCAIKVSHPGNPDVIRIPKPRETSARLLSALSIQMPEILPCLNTPVVTRKKLQPSRKKR